MNPTELREVKCPGCAGEFSLGEEFWDKNVVCPVCATAFYVRPPAYQPGAQHLRPGQIILDDFQVEKLLGEGGTGRVYLFSSQSTGSRFAVKHLKGLSESERRKFLTQLQPWIDLPAQANLVPCRFVRNLGDELLIFVEHVESGSLKQWIEEGKLYVGDPGTALARMLGVAMQFAWGLHCLHERHLVHQRVKPANVMMLPDGTPRIRDLGLANLGGRGHRSDAADARQYEAPEQAAGQAVSRATDLWSWGLSVLEIFAGRVTWNSGPAAADALEAYLRERGPESPIPEMPLGLVVLLMGCFQPEPAMRWGNLAAVIEKLKVIYAQVTKTDYAPKLNTEGVARQPDVAVELAAHGETKRLYARLLRAGRNELRSDLAMLCLEMARLHLATGAGAGTLPEYDQAIAIYDRLVNQEGQRELAEDLASACLGKARVVSDLGDLRAAVALYDQAITIWERLVNQEGRRELANELAGLYFNKANALGELGDQRGAVTLYDQALAIRVRLVSQEGRVELANDLAMVLMNKANLVGALKDPRGAIALYDQVIAIRERLVNQEGRRELANDLAMVLMNKANALGDLGDQRGALAFYDQAIAIRERLVNQEGRHELADDLATVYMNKAVTLGDLRDHRAAVALFDPAAAIWEKLMAHQGRRELAEKLARLKASRGESLIALGEKANGLQDLRAAQSLLETEIVRTDRADLKEFLTWLKSRIARLAR